MVAPPLAPGRAPVSRRTGDDALERPRSAARQPGRGHQQTEEQHEERDAGGSPATRTRRAHVVRGDGGGDTDRQTAEVGERQAGEAADRRGPERLDDQQGEHHGVQVEGGGSRMPARVAKMVPMIQAHRRTAAGLVPPRSSSSGLSTTPRMASPSRVSRKNRNRATVAASAMPVMIIWSSPTNAPPMLTVSWGSHAGKVRASVPNVAEKNPWTARTMPTVATTCMVADASASRRAIASRPRPSTGPSTKRRSAR